MSEIAQHSLGKMLDKSKNKGEPRPYLRNLNVRWFEFALNDVLEMRFLPEEEARYTAVNGDVLICEGGYPGRAAIWTDDEPIYFQKALHRVRFHEPERNKWFVYYLHFRDLEGTLSKHFNGAGIQHFTGEALAKFELPIPPLPEQQRIVGILDEAFEGIATAKANAEKNLQNARALFESHLQSVFTQRGDGWVDTQLGEFCEFFNGKAHEKCIDAEGSFVVVNSKFISSNGSVKKRTNDQLFPLYVDDIVMVMSDVPNGKALAKCYLIEQDDTYTLNQRICAIRTNRFTKRFLLYQLNRHPYLLAFDNKGSQANLRKNDILSCPLFAPADQEQRRIANRLDEVAKYSQRLETIYQRKLAALDNLKKSLLHQAFSGEL